MAALEAARQLADAGDRWADQMERRQIDREVWEARIAQQQADYWARRDAEVGR